MKLKKLFAGVVAAAMIATMSFPAFAATNGLVHTLTNNKVEVDKVYKLVGVGDSPLETFGFNISALTRLNKNGAEKVANVPVPTVGSADFSGTHATAAGATKKVSVDFSNCNYTNVGTYYYKITENATTNAGVTISTPTQMRVTVVNDEDNGGVKIASVTFWKQAESDTADGEWKDKIDETTAFENTYTANSLTLKKTVRGNMGDKNNDKFTFKVTLTGEDGKTYAENYAVVGGSVNETKTVKVDGKTYNITIKHGEEITIANLPAGVTYKVEEDAADGYTAYTKYGILDSDKVAGTTVEGTTSAAAAEAAFTNVKDGTPDTGVILDNAPYMLMLAIVAGGAMTLVIKKRREEE